MWGNGGGESARSLRLRGVSVFRPAEGDADSQLEKLPSAPILHGIDLEIRPGEWVYAVGVNGCGKSTLARLLAGLYSGGTVHGAVERGFAGETVSPIVLQRPETQLFGETPREELAFALSWRGVPRERMAPAIQQALDRAGLADLADTRWARLSGGQRQLAAVAAAAVLPAPLYVFDEATAMLDDANRERVLAWARRLREEGAAVVWVTQRLDELRPGERTIAVSDGRISYDGEARAFFYGVGQAPSPCEVCGLRLPYMAELALEMRKRGRLADPLPLTDAEWEEVLADGRIDG